MANKTDPARTKRAADEEVNDLTIAEYVAAELDGQPVAQLFPQVQEQLQSSAHTRKIYEHLRAIELAEREGRLDSKERTFTADLSFLKNKGVIRAKTHR